MTNLKNTIGDQKDSGHELDNKAQIPCLEVRHKGKSKIHIIENKLTIGVQKSCHIIFKNPQMAPLHCYFSKQGKVILLTVLDNQVKTYLGEDELLPNKTVILKDQDKLRIGGSELRLRFLGKSFAKKYSVLETKDSSQKITQIKQEMQIGSGTDSSHVNDSELPPPLPAEITNNLKPKKELVIEESGPPLPKEIQKEKLSLLGFLKLNLSIYCAFIIDLALAYTLYYQFRLFEGFKEYVKSLNFVFGPVIESKWIVDSPAILMITLSMIFYATRTLYSSLFGVSLGQLMVGMRSGDSFVWNRIGGTIRCFIAVVTTPLIVFDLPAMFKKRTFKELISLTTIKYFGFKKGLLPSIILFPLSVFLLFLWPYFYYSNKKFDISYTNYNSKNEVSSIDLANNYKVVRSRHFKFEFLQNLKSNFLFMPAFDLIKKGHKQRIRPFIEIYDRKRSIRGEFRVKKRSTLYKELNEISKSIPFFENDFPLLSKYLTGNAHLKRKNKITPETLRQLNHFISLSINLSFKESVKQIFKFRPFIYGLLNFREKILSGLGELKEQDEISVNIIEWGDQSFLVAYSNQNYYFKNKDSRQKFVIPLHSMNGLIYEILWEDSPKYVKTDIDFFNQLVKGLKWKYDELTFKNMFYFEDKEKDPLNYLSQFHIIDYYALSKNLSKERFAMDNYLFNFYLNASQQALESDSRKEKDILMENIQHMIGVSELVSNGSKNQIRSINNLKEIRWALVNSNKDFFINKQEQLQGLK